MRAYGCLPAPICPTQRLTRANRGCFLCIPGDGVLFVNSVVILPLEERAFLLYALRPSGRQKWVRASARSCARRIAGRDACPTRGWVKLFLRPVAADGRRWQSALQGGGCWFIQLYFLPVRFILNFEEGLVSRTVSHLRSTLPPWGAEWLRRARGCCPVPFAPRSGSHGQTGAVFSALRETAFPFLDAS